MNERRENKTESKKRRRDVFFKFCLLSVLCVSLGLIDGLRSYASSYYNGVFALDFSVALRWDISGWLIWILFIPLVFWLSRRFPLNRKTWRRAFLVYLPVGLLLSLARTFFPALVDAFAFGGMNDLRDWMPHKSFFLITDFAAALIFYALVLAYGQAINYYKQLRQEEVRTSRLEVQLSRAQLDALKMQLHPHFLFNTLNSISALQMENVGRAQEMTARLGDFLRMTLENVGANTVTLEREIEFLECYLDIEKVRFGQRLATSVEVAPEILECRVPNLILQPLVENAIRHGISRQPAGRIAIRAGRENGWLKLEVADNGRGIEKENLEKALTSGIGLSNTKARLEQLYGENFRFDLQNVEAGGLLAILRLPQDGKRDEEDQN